MSSDPMSDVHQRVWKILTDDYVKLVSSLSGKEKRYWDTTMALSIIAFIFTGIAAVLSFSAGSFDNRYLSFAAGCAAILAMIFRKSALYANSQSQYQESKLKNILTTDYQFLYQFLTSPLSLKLEPEPTMPDIDLEKGLINDKKRTFKDPSIDIIDDGSKNQLKDPLITSDTAANITINRTDNEDHQ